MTNSQVKRFKACVKCGKSIPKDIRKKMYHLVKRQLKIGEGMCERIYSILIDYCMIDCEEFLLQDVQGIFKELNKDLYIKLFKNRSIDAFWDSLGHEGYKRRIDFLNYIIERM